MLDQGVDLSQGITLLSGEMFDYKRPHDCEVRIEDIAGALSKICRFAGHVRCFYSVAQHAVNVSRIVPEEHALDGLLHDTAEAFTNDLPTPLKHAVPVFGELEKRIEAAMGARFGFAWPMPAAVRTADLQMLAIEKHRLKGDTSRWTILDGIETDSIVGKVDLSEWTPRQAEERFLARYYSLLEVSR